MLHLNLRTETHYQCCRFCQNDMVFVRLIFQGLESFDCKLQSSQNSNAYSDVLGPGGHIALENEGALLYLVIVQCTPLYVYQMRYVHYQLDKV